MRLVMLFFIFCITLISLIFFIGYVYTQGDETAPLWRSQTTNDTDNVIPQSGGIILAAQGFDETGLDWAWLATNETGQWKNYTENYTWWNSSFTKRRNITINNTQNSNTLIDYQVLINITYDSDMQPDYDDLRFTWYNSTSGSEQEINYSVESFGYEGTLYLGYDDGIKCYLNNQMILNGLEEYHGVTWWYYELDISYYLKQGENLLACWVANGGENIGSSEGGLDLKLVVDGQVIINQSDDDSSTSTKDSNCAANPEFKYYNCSHSCEPSNWYNTSFDDSSWNSGNGPFGNVSSWGCTNALTTAPDDLFIRKNFTLGSKSHARVWVKIPKITANSYETVYMYYGNSSVTSTALNSSELCKWQFIPDSAFYSKAGTVSLNQDADDSAYVDLDYSSGADPENHFNSNYNEWIKYSLSFSKKLYKLEIDFDGAYLCYSGYCVETCGNSYEQTGCAYTIDTDTEHGTHNPFVAATETDVAGTPSRCLSSPPDLHSSGDVFETIRLTASTSAGINTTKFKYLELIRGGGGPARGDCYIDYIKVCIFNYTPPEPTYSVGSEETFQPNYYNSPMDMGDATTWTWSNFTWQNSSLAGCDVVGWRIYYKDTSGNENATDILTFNVCNISEKYLYELTGMALYYDTGLPVQSGFVRGIVKETGEVTNASISNGYFVLKFNTTINATLNKFTLGLALNSSDNKMGYIQLIAGSGKFADTIQACSIKQWHFKGIALDTSGALISSGNVMIGVEGEQVYNSTNFSNGLWDIYISPCLVPGNLYTFRVTISSDSKTSIISIRQVAK